MIGVDLKKDLEVLKAAYDDSHGISRAFAMNVLERMNRELGSDFDETRFDYRAPFNEVAGRIEMQLVSLEDQKVNIDGRAIALRQGESILTEYSHKYTTSEFAAIAEEAGLRVEQVWTDDRRLFSVQYCVIA